MDWKRFCALIEKLADPATPWPGQVGLVREWYKPQLERIYDAAFSRAGDLEQLEHLSAQHPSRERFLTELTLDPPAVTGDQSGAASKDEDYVILSTIHSAKGQEWDIVYVLNVADGNFPSEFSAGKPEMIEEERRLLYVAMTRARNELHLCAPLKYQVTQQAKDGDAHVYGAKSRFMTDKVLACFERTTFRSLHGRRELCAPRRESAHGRRRRAAQGNVVSGNGRRTAPAMPPSRVPDHAAQSITSIESACVASDPDGQNPYQRRATSARRRRRRRRPGAWSAARRSWASFTRSGRPPIWKPFVC